ncbi:valine--tRNA ligase, partial [Candidatus Woesearchaeota archaeon]|nr:valine--tRNA ligase [Candidatus Woesearchaeota archaeon]
PPTVSGKMHLGHSFSYTQQDICVRYKRQRGFNVYFPFGTDDNGLATERLIEKEKKVKAVDMDREEFIKICVDTLEKELRPKYISDWKAIGMSCEWSYFYTTINEHSRKISQWSFLDLYKKGREYRKEAPVVWCPECRTAIAQVEMEDKDIESAFIDIVFKAEGQDLIISTTRPELLPACVAVFYHPDDKRYQKLKGKKAKVPIMDYEVPILEDERADPEKGTGLVMCCTFGDSTDVEWYKAHNLPLKEALAKDGTLTAIAGKYKGLKAKDARKEIISDLAKEGLMKGSKDIVHPVNVHERCGTELEILNSKQWFIKYLDLKDEFIKRGQELKWHPAHYYARLKNWIEGLQWDWCISRQRYFGVPFPVWYCADCDEIILAREEDLPVDPLEDKPHVKECPKCKSKNFVPEKDVLDTWATSSLTPQLATWLVKDENVRKKIYPMSLRPQAHDIISFWLFNTIVKSHLHFNKLPWKEATISGWALDPKGRKMSKSKGNVIEPQEMIKKYSADCLRYWASSSKLGDDVPFQEKEFVTGQKLVTKLWNASNFVFMHIEDYDLGKPKKLEMMDRWLLSKLNSLVKDATEFYDSYDYSRAKLETSNFFWQVFCTHYLEIVKDRIYNPDKRGKDARESAQYTLYTSLSAVLKLFAPVLVFVTEEIYSSYFNEKEGKKSIHVSEWPKYDESNIHKDVEEAGDHVFDIVAAVRKYKSSKGMSLKQELKAILIDKKILDMIKEAEADIKAATGAKELKEGTGDVACESGLKIGIEE